ncbi:MAG: CpsD/CapB family tyrosine-protein kinase, partial [Leptolyngbya sp. SIO4C5]|nr:CpsD/CapB family tyrosine-protein kinase [Leptolyngbya sp. SIO4C5]
SHHHHLGYTSPEDLRGLLAEPERVAEPERYWTGVKNLHAITTASPVRQPSELLASRELREVLAHARTVYDLIVFDAPPVLLAADAALLATQCEACFLVAGSGTTDARALDQTIKELEGVGAAMVGVVLNRFDPSNMIGYKDTYRYRYQAYGYGEEVQ